MANLIDSYLSRLQSRLVKRIPLDAANEHVKEIGTHLRESISDQVSIGRSEDIATLGALKSLGSDRLVADGIIRARTGIDNRSAWRVAWLSVFLLIAYCALNQWIQFSTDYWLEAYLPWGAIAFVGVFSYACWRSRRLLIVPIGLAIAIVFTVVTTHGILFSSQVHARTLQFVNRLITDGQHQLVVIDTVSKTYRYPVGSGNADPGIYWAPKPGQMRIMSQLNWTPYSYETGRSTNLQIAPVSTETEARKLWKQNGERYTNSLALGLQREEAIRTKLMTTKLDFATACELTFDTFLNAMGFLAVIMLLNLLVLTLGYIHRKTVAQLWRPDRLKAASHG